ncbi:hypothetical protein GKC32_10695 (plasmid) [Lactobacillus curvatus]|nr:hypothetical protein [Latilactobacillus curvatus]MSD84705.1 hypothetical protein [Latilactobacillus curvatus]MSE23441.1 hypothetical protein [Latilactobacillus curvatus]MSE24905.1 hypothetical protein [Latilactobacillus curvatus]
MDKLVYFYDECLKFDHVGVINAGEDVPENATTVAPEGYEPFSYNESLDSWIGVSKEEWEKSHPSKQMPSETEQLKLMIGNLVSENANKDQSIKQLQAMTGNLVAQIAELNKGGY